MAKISHDQFLKNLLSSKQKSLNNLDDKFTMDRIVYENLRESIVYDIAKLKNQVEMHGNE